MLGNPSQRTRGIRFVHSLLFYMVVAFFSAASAQAATVTLAWDPSTSAVAGYRVYYGQASGAYTATTPIAPELVTGTQHTTPDLPAGTYYFAVKAFDSAGNESPYSNEVSTTIGATVSAPTAAFTYTLNPTSATAPVVASFTDGSTGTITGWSWTFGDGATGTSQNPSHTYASAGTYTVSLTVTGPGGSHTTSRAITVNAPLSAPVASFTAAMSPTTGQVPLSVIFTDTSTGTVTTRSWKFSDTTTAFSTQTVARSYNAPGTYTAELTVGNASGSSTAIQTITAVVASPTADFSANVTSGTAPLTVRFTDASTPADTVTAWAWNFGDGNSGVNNTSTEQNPVHIYTAAGTYTVTLTATNASGSGTKVKTGFVTVTPSNITEGLVAAFNFEEGAGSVVVDASGNANHGIVSGAVRTASGKFGNALTFDGVDDGVSIADAQTLSLANGMTLEAWVYPTVAMSGWKSVVTKENPAGSTPYDLFANSDVDRPAAAVYTTDRSPIYGTLPLGTNQWVHLAATYDGVTMRLYVNGQAVSAQPETGDIQVTGGALRIGGVTGQFFKGIIDEVRVYDRALSASEIQTDQSTAIATSSPANPLLGEQSIGPVTETLLQGVAMAFQATATETGTMAQLPVYVDAGSLCARVSAGVYSDKSGVPGTLIAVGSLSAPKAGAWNTVLMPATSIDAGGTYWVAILSTSGTLKFHDQAGTTLKPAYKNKQTGLKALPTIWKTGTRTLNGPMSAYGAGY